VSLCVVRAPSILHKPTTHTHTHTYTCKPCQLGFLRWTHTHRLTDHCWSCDLYVTLIIIYFIRISNQRWTSDAQWCKQRSPSIIHPPSDCYRYITQLLWVTHDTMLRSITNRAVRRACLFVSLRTSEIITYMFLVMSATRSTFRCWNRFSVCLSFRLSVRLCVCDSLELRVDLFTRVSK